MIRVVAAEAANGIEHERPLDVRKSAHVSVIRPMVRTPAMAMAQNA